MLNSQAPDFRLEASDGSDVSLKDLSGSYVVLVFYPANDTPVCNSQLSDMNINMDEFSSHGIKVFGVNPATATKHQGYCERKALHFPILSDPGAKVAGQYGASYRWLPMVVNRTVVAVDPKGKICFYQHGKPSPETVFKAIEQNRAGG